MYAVFTGMYTVSAAEEFTLMVYWTAVSQAKAGILQHTITDERRVLEMTLVVNANVVAENGPSGSNVYTYCVGMEIVFNPPTGVVSGKG